MSKRPSKAELRKQLDDEVQHFIEHGGEVQELPRGATGLVDGRYQALGFDRKSETRTDVTEVLKTIDQRREQQRKPKPTPQKKSQPPQKKIIYDDFGEPIRIVWE